MDKNVLNQLSNYTIGEVDFFNPKMSQLRLNVSISTGSMQVSMAKTLDPNVASRPAPGQKVYDHDNKVFYSISPVECSYISRNMQALAAGSYKNPNPKEKQTDAITLNHFRENQLSKLVIERAIKDGKFTGAMKLTIFPPKGEKGTITSYVLRQEELIIFNKYLQHCAYDLPYHMSLIKGFVKSLNKAMWDSDEYQKKKGGSTTNNYSKKNETKSFDEESDDSSSSSEPADESTEEEYDIGSDDSGDPFGFN